MQALILSAGLGTRLRPYTLDQAKPSIPFLNIPMLGYSLYPLEKAGLTRLVLNTHHLPESIQTTANSLSLPSYSVKFSHEKVENLGGGGALREAKHLLDPKEPVFLLNGDCVFIAANPSLLKTLFDFHSKEEAFATLLVAPHAEVGKTFGGVYTEKSQLREGIETAKIKTFSKTPVEGLQGFHYVGPLVLSPKAFSMLPSEGASNILYEVLQKAIDRGEKVIATIDRGLRWFETGDPTSYLKSSREVLQLLQDSSSLSRYLQELLRRFTPGWDNFKKENVYSFQPLPESVGLQASCLGLVGREVQFKGNSSFKDFVVIGPRSKIESDTSIEASVMLPHRNLNKGEKLYSRLF